MKRTMRWLLVWGIVGGGVSAEEVRFNRDIRPIFLKHCTSCHGGVKEAGGISFVYRERLLVEGESGHIAVVPGKPEQSELLKRVRSKDPEYVMPQPEHGDALDKADVALLERWIKEGAKWEEHWAFVAPEKVPVTGLKNEAWVAQELDRYVLKGIENAGLKPSNEAGPGEWLRRVSFDLTGLPPRVEDLEKLEAEWAASGEAAREKVVDGLLASPAYGERWATVWLDLARYADTYGFEKDPHREIWPWRDWVVRALNADMPYNEFTVRQLAGDLLPNGTADDVLATAFHRNTQTNTEGGTDDEEFRVAAVIDRISTVWTTWQATTFGCVQCHSHPYDPIEHGEFYKFMAFFNGTEDSDMSDDYPKLRIPDGEDKGEWLRLNRETKLLRDELNSEAKKLIKVPWKALEEMEFRPDHGTLRVAEDGLIVSEGNLLLGTTHRISGKTAGLDAFRLMIFPNNADPKSWPEHGVLVTQFKVERILPDGTRSEVKMKEVISDHLAGPFDAMSAFTGDEFKRFLELNNAVRAPAVGARGGIGEFPRLSGPRWFVMVAAERVELAAGERIEVSLAHDGILNDSNGMFLRKFRLEVSKNDIWQGLRANTTRAEKWAKIFSNRDRMAAIQGIDVPIMMDRPANGSRQTRVFSRGNRLMKGEVVNADVPKILRGEFVNAKSPSRLDMARWMVSGKNPLTARVMVNRLWGEIFGIGIVETREDFGTSGTPPSDLALLDFLALRFQNEQGWSMKKALREMVLSSTYRQSSKANAKLKETDPRNRLLARGPRNRLGAEMIRDQALSVSGLLSPKMSGVPVFPPQPAGVWSGVYSAEKWIESTGEDRFRRGLYTYVKRTSGFPGFLTFDATSRDVCSARRIISNTPLQALVAMNDPAHIEAAKAMAGRMKAKSADLREQLAFGVLLATQVRADEETLGELMRLHDDLKTDYASKPDEAAKLGEDAPLVLTANTILNMDAALVK
ncbi:MAG: PSD1 domain-containing protein [Armatimonadetes bacterium]|nr:PSD1 domain-containing protein [Akkermansiaceae bacterium]